MGGRDGRDNDYRQIEKNSQNSKILLVKGILSSYNVNYLRKPELAITLLTVDSKSVRPKYFSKRLLTDHLDQARDPSHEVMLIRLQMYDRQERHELVGYRRRFY